jgi:hypothetical protein
MSLGPQCFHLRLVHTSRWRRVARLRRPIRRVMKARHWLDSSTQDDKRTEKLISIMSINSQQVSRLLRHLLTPSPLQTDLPVKVSDLQDIPVARCFGPSIA